MAMPLILASQSAVRTTVLANAGIGFTTQTARIDERAIEEAVAGSGITPAELATILAEAKALSVSEHLHDAYVLGADQTLSLEDTVLHKAQNIEQARRRLVSLSGRTHMLNSALVITRADEVVWRHVSVARLTMRQLTPAFIGRHLARVGEEILASVGCYQIEGEGVQLFEEIDGDYFTIVGLPLLPLLKELRRLGVIDG